jgi:hypothetical protein
LLTKQQIFGIPIGRGVNFFWRERMATCHVARGETDPTPVVPFLQDPIGHGVFLPRTIVNLPRVQGENRSDACYSVAAGFNRGHVVPI